jgi:hypothetical protein
MKKLLFGVITSTSLLANTAYAVITENPAGSGRPVWSSSNTYEIYLSGASAPRQFIESYLTAPTVGAGSVPAANRLCAGKVYLFLSPNNNYNAYLCEMNNATSTPAFNALKGANGGKINILFHKRSAGGSAQGVSPVIADSAIDFLNVFNGIIPAGCAVASNSAARSTINCPTPAPGANLQKPDFGVSDVDPLQFLGSNTPLGFGPVTATQVATLTVRPAFAQIFGIPVGLKLRNALQQVQFVSTSKCNPLNAGYLSDSIPGKAGIQPWSENAACVPNMTTDDITSILTGKITSGKQLYISNTSLYDRIAAVNPALLPGNASLHVCSRVNGSGTKATTGIKFLNYPCTGVATQPRPDTGGLDPVDNAFIDFNIFGFSPETAGQPQIHQNSSGGDVNECFNELDGGINNNTGNFRNNPFTTVSVPSTRAFRWTIGIQGTDNNASLANAYRFIKIDGLLPTALNVINGGFHDWVESTYQFKNSHIFNPGEATIRDYIISQSGLPSVVGIVNQSGSGYGSLVAGSFVAGVGQANHSWGASGFLASPANPAVITPVSGTYNLSLPINPLSHDTTVAGSSVNNCRHPALYSNGTSPLFNKGLQIK